MQKYEPAAFFRKTVMYKLAPFFCSTLIKSTVFDAVIGSISFSTMTSPSLSEVGVPPSFWITT